jgi:hypothetical protein
MSFETNLRACGQAIATVRFVCTFGAANKRSDVEKHIVTLKTGGQFSKTKLLNALQVHEYDKTDAEARSREFKIPIDAALGRLFHTGACETQASVAFEFLKNVGTPLPIDFMTNDNDSHAFVVIGRTGLATNWSDWGADAVVCDPWLNDSPDVSVDGAGTGWEAWPFRPSVWAGTNLVLGSQTPRKLSSYTFKSEYQFKG